LARNALKR